RVEALAARHRGRTIRFGLEASADVTAEQVSPGESGTAFRLKTPAGDADIGLALPGPHQGGNFLAASAAAIAARAEAPEQPRGGAAVAGSRGSPRSAAPPRLGGAPLRRRLQREPALDARGPGHVEAPSRPAEDRRPGRHARARTRGPLVPPRGRPLRRRPGGPAALRGSARPGDRGGSGRGGLPGRRGRDRARSGARRGSSGPEPLRGRHGALQGVAGRRARPGGRPSESGGLMLSWLLYPLAKYLPAFNVFRYITFRAAMAAVTALLLALLFGGPMIRLLKSRQIGQSIRKEGPQSHQVKAGTPTMGGLLILLAVIAATFLWMDLTNRFVWIALATLVAFGAVGFADDFIKFARRRNLGLSGRGKLVPQFLAALAIAWAIRHWAGTETISTVVTFPFLK